MKLFIFKHLKQFFHQCQAFFVKKNSLWSIKPQNEQLFFNAEQKRDKPHGVAQTA